MYFAATSNVYYELHTHRPFALLIIAILPFMSIGKAVEIQVMMGDEKTIPDELPANSSGGIVVESLLNIRTVASLSIEEKRIANFEGALRRENPHPVRTNTVKGSAGGLAQIVQMWGIALMFWWGGYLLYKYPNTYTFRDMLISLFGMMFGFTGLGIAMQDLTDSEKARAAAARIFELIDRKSEIDPLTDEGKKLD
jgi:ABC-type multidrug transport system fused ATPase/permease subunit